MAEFLSKEALKRALTGLHEQVHADPLLGGNVLIRELTARQRTEANAAAVEENEDRPNQALYQAMLIQYAVVDPASGTAYADGRRDQHTGEITIDPRTRASLLSLDDVIELMDGRSLPIQALVTAISALSAVRAVDTFPSDRTPDSVERNAPQGDGDGGTEFDGFESGALGADNDGTPHTPAESNGVGPDVE